MCFPRANASGIWVCKLMSPVVLAQHVTKWYGPRRAVTDVSFAIEQGEIVGLLGPNGSGKSTIFRMLTGYLVPSSGSIEVAGHDVVAEFARGSPRDQLRARGRPTLRPHAGWRVSALYGRHQGFAQCCRAKVRWTRPPSGSI